MSNTTTSFDDPGEAMTFQDEVIERLRRLHLSMGEVGTTQLAQSTAQHDMLKDLRATQLEHGRALREQGQLIQQIADVILLG